MMMMIIIIIIIIIISYTNQICFTFSEGFSLIFLGVLKELAFESELADSNLRKLKHWPIANKKYDNEKALKKMYKYSIVYIVLKSYF